MTTLAMMYLEKKINEIVHCAASRAFRDLSRNPFSKLTLWYLPSGMEWGDVTVSETRPNYHADWQEWSKETVPANLTMDGLKAWIRERVRKMPICA